MKPERSISGQPQIISEFADDAEFCDLIQLFVSELPERVAAIENAFGLGNHEEVTRLAHQLKGSGPGYGFPMIGEAAGTIEAWYRARSAPSVDELIAMREQIDTLIDLCRRAAPPA